MAGTTVQRCTCKHEYQDKKYGKQLRVFNKSGSSKVKVIRCTVCGAEHK